jgi:hypothetical protein
MKIKLYSVSKVGSLLTQNNGSGDSEATSVGFWLSLLRSERQRSDCLDLEGFSGNLHCESRAVARLFRKFSTPSSEARTFAISPTRETS